MVIAIMRGLNMVLGSEVMVKGIMKCMEVVTVGGVMVKW